jgi:hypothetical protein
MKIRTVRAELLWEETERQTGRRADRPIDLMNDWRAKWQDMAKLIVAFRNFAKAP